MANKPIAAEIYTSSHRILGRISFSGTGLYSFLNIPTTSYVEVSGALLSRLHQPNRMIARYPTLWLVKQEVVAILLSNRLEMGITGVARSGYSHPVSHWIHVMIGGYELRGVIETRGKFNFGAVMFEGNLTFVPLYDTSLTAILFPQIKAESPAVLFNRKKVDAVALLPQPNVPPKSKSEQIQPT